MYGATTCGTAATDVPTGGRSTDSVRRSADREASEDNPTWRSIGLATMAAMLVVSLRRVGSRAFEARCQWPRFHPLNERHLPVSHHPLIMVESVRQVAMALAAHLPPSAGDLEPVSVRLGLSGGGLPLEGGDATDVLLRVALGDVEAEDGRCVAYRLTADCLHAGQRFASCAMRLARPAPHAPDALGTASPPGMLYPSAAAVGAAAEPDVLLARAPQGRMAIAPRDPGHPVFLAGRPSCVPALAVLEAGRQAALLCCGRPASAIRGLSVDLHGAVPLLGAFVELSSSPLGPRFAVLTAGRVAATGGVGLLPA
ncbi:AfsA-related hotdog domain-containing protein [Streptomyces sp. NPDC060205]|uniref:AfsA-related hotdog domain-containing protein n=1 Tax=Streptomyces sp. NPDC060205 TaxID=3347072 RepID=UPI00365D0A7B